MTVRQYLSDSCEEIDASIFSGDVLHNDEERKLLKEYLERWAKAISGHESELEATPKCVKCGEELFEEERHFRICEDCRANATDLESLL